jgi:DNA primase
MISPFSIQKVMDRLDIIELIGSFIKLKKRGANYLGNCPFHNEKTPSFTVSSSKKIYKCFGCGKAGNGLTFIQEHEKLSYPEAIRWLAKFYNIQLEETVATEQVQEQLKAEESLRIVSAYAQKYFTSQLNDTDEGQQIGLSYFKERGFLDITIDKYLLGYAPNNRNSLVEDAKKNGYDLENLQKCGLVNNRNNQYYDNYSGRVIFPIQNISGKVIGFGARILIKNDKAPKYINTPENEIYNKSKVLYGLFQARNAIVKQDECLLVEGYTDVISMAQAGVENVVASSGTALTTEQLKLIKRYTKNLTIIYDGDAAGIKAATRGLDLAVEEGLNVQLVLLPDGHDPDSFVQANGQQGFEQYLSTNKKDIILFKLEISLKDAGNDNVKKAELVNEIANTLSKINKAEEFTKQQDYIKRCAELLKIDEQGLITLVNKKIREKYVKDKQLEKQDAEQLEHEANPEQEHNQQEATSLLQKDYVQEKSLIKILLEYGNLPFDEKISVAQYIQIKVGADVEFINSKWHKIFYAYYSYLNTFGQSPSFEYFSQNEDKALQNDSIEATYLPYDISENWQAMHNIHVPDFASRYLEETENTIIYFLLRKLKNIIESYLADLSNPNLPEDEIKIYMESIKQVQDIERELVSKMKVFFYK